MYSYETLDTQLQKNFLVKEAWEKYKKIWLAARMMRLYEFIRRLKLATILMCLHSPVPCPYPFFWNGRNIYGTRYFRNVCWVDYRSVWNRYDIYNCVTK